MLAHGFSHKPRYAETVVVDEVAHVLAAHLEAWAIPAEMPGGGKEGPVLVHVDGPGRSLFLDKLDARLAASPGSSRWTVIRFDAWQYQRVPPPWWWLIKSIDSQLRVNRPGCRRVWLRRRAADHAMRIRRLLRDLVIAVPVIAITIAAALAAQQLSGKHAILDVLQWATGVLAAVTTLLGLGGSAVKAFRRHLLAESPLGATAVLRTSDPMAELERRYAFLVRSARTRVAILIDNLDRCRSEYVVELLEGIQTLLRQPHARGDLPAVVFVVAAERAWLCDSYVNVYEDFEAAARQPGRPFGLAFLDKIFDLSVRMPTVSAAASLGASDPPVDPTSAVAQEIEAAESELGVRRALAAAERAAAGDLAPGEPVPPRQGLRLCAVRRLMSIEEASPNGACQDTDRALEQLTRRLDPGPTFVRQLPSAYCVQRIGQLLAGHAVDEDDDAIRRLGVWTLLTLRWPLLADHLVRFPEHADAICEQAVPDGVGDDLAPVFALNEVHELAALAREVKLDGAAVVRLNAPIRLQERVPVVHLEPAPAIAAHRAA